MCAGSPERRTKKIFRTVCPSDAFAAEQICALLPLLPQNEQAVYNSPSNASDSDDLPRPLPHAKLLIDLNDRHEFRSPGARRDLYSFQIRKPPLANDLRLKLRHNYACQVKRKHVFVIFFIKS